MPTKAAPVVNGMNIPGTFEVYEIETGCWYSTSVELKTAEATVEMLNQRANGPRYTWWWVR